MNFNVEHCIRIPFSATQFFLAIHATTSCTTQKTTKQVQETQQQKETMVENKPDAVESALTKITPLVVSFQCHCNEKFQARGGFHRKVRMGTVMTYACVCTHPFTFLY
jgi:hypothetical protein